MKESKVQLHLSVKSEFNKQTDFTRVHVEGIGYNIIARVKGFHEHAHICVVIRNIAWEGGLGALTDSVLATELEDCEKVCV